MAIGSTNAAGASVPALRELEAKITAIEDSIYGLVNGISVIPSQSEPLTYNGQSQSPTWANYDPERLTIGGELSGTDAGTYTATFTPTAGNTWGDGTTAAKSVDWIIKCQMLRLPHPQGSLTYTGEEQSPVWIDYDASRMTIGGDTSASDAGTYAATFTPMTNYCWTDSSTTAKTVNWTIGGQVVQLPIARNRLVYNGTQQQSTWIGSTEPFNTGGTMAATNAGTYTATFTPKPGYNWEDGTAEMKSVDWEIKQAIAYVEIEEPRDVTIDIDVGYAYIISYEKVGNVDSVSPVILEGADYVDRIVEIADGGGDNQLRNGLRVVFKRTPPGGAYPQPGNYEPQVVTPLKPVTGYVTIKLNAVVTDANYKAIDYGNTIEFTVNYYSSGYVRE